MAEKVLKVVSHIPEGKVLSYKKVAELAGRPCAFRAVGHILSKNYDPKIPCYRVIRANGEIGGHNRGRDKKRFLLKKEGAI